MLSSDPIWSFADTIPFDGRSDYLLAPTFANESLESGSVALSFEVADLNHRQTLFAKNHRGREAAGQISASVANGRLEVKIENKDETAWLTSGRIQVGREYQAVVTWGDEGFRLYLDGRTIDAQVDFTDGLAGNPYATVIGASNSDQSGTTTYTNAYLEGAIGEVAIYDYQLGFSQIEDLAGISTAAPTSPRFINGVLTGTDGSDVIFGWNVNGGYGDDILTGTAGPDRLDGGYGEDILSGGEGNDVLVSRSDGGEPTIAQAFGPDFDPLGEVDPISRTLAPTTPIAADDLLIGGKGADTFRFELLMNAKERVLFRKAQADGSIDWHGVARENESVHDHWVERIGDDVIADFNRAEGDKIHIVGHTADVYSITHYDTNGDGVLDATMLSVQANQGPWGAHTKDHLGTITVYGDLVLTSDLHVHGHAHAGVVESIGELEQALAPRLGSPVVTDGVSRWARQVVAEAPLPEGAAFTVGGTITLDGQDDYLQTPSLGAASLASGSAAMSFRVDDLLHRQTLFAKDHSGVEAAGQIKASIANGRIEVRIENDSETAWLYSGRIQAGSEYHTVVTWGDDGFRLYLNGELVDSDETFTSGLAGNRHALVVGASNSSQTSDKLILNAALEGEIERFTIYDHQVSDRLAELLAADAIANRRDRTSGYRPPVRGNA